MSTDIYNTKACSHGRTDAHLCKLKLTGMSFIWEPGLSRAALKHQMFCAVWGMTKAHRDPTRPQPATDSM